MGNRFRLSTVFAPILVFALAGCGGDDPPPPDTQPTTTPATQPATGAATTPVPDVSGVDLPQGVTADMVAQGRTIYHGQGICFSCHGQEGAGGPLGPALNDQDWLNISTGDFEEIVTVIRTGVAQPAQFPAPMPPMGGASLSDEQLRQVAAYVYSISHAS